MPAFSRFPAFHGLFLGVTLLLLVGACRKAPQGSAAERDIKSAKTRADDVLTTTRAGLAAAATSLGATPIESLMKDAIHAKDSLVQARRGVEDLRLAPLTFVALLDPQSRVIRSSLEVDAVATTKLEVPCAAATTAPAVASTAVLPGILGPTLLLCVPFPKKNEGALLAGVTYADLAFVLRNHVKDTYEKERDAGRFEAKTPLLYGAVFDDKLLAWTQETPEIMRSACERTGFRTVGSPVTLTLEVEERPYAISKETLLVPKGGTPVSFAIIHSDI